MPLRREVPLLVESGLEAAASVARDRVLLDAVRAGAAPGALRVHDGTGDVLTLGRWHLAPPPAAEPAPVVVHRHTGGRAAPAGAGFVGVSLVLPHRAALFGDDPGALRPEQVMNRYVRGILAGLEGAGVPAVYPGRDTITVGRRIVGFVAFAERADGTLLFEALLAVGRDASVLPVLLDRADPGGVVHAWMLHPADVTSVGAVLGRVPALDEVAGWIARGYEERLGLAAAPRPWTAADLVAIGDATRSAAASPAARAPRADLDRRAFTPTLLGRLEAHLALAPDGTIGDVMLAGDLLAGDDTVPALEAALRGCLPTRDALETAVHAALAERRRWILGIGATTTLTDTVMRAAAG